MQNEKNNQQDEAGLTEAELHFAQSLEQTLNQALGESDKVTSIWSRLKPDQRARIAEDYLSKLLRSDQDDDDEDTSRDTSGRQNTAPSSSFDAGFVAQKPTPQIEDRPASDNQYRPPRGYPADFNPLAGFPGLEPTRTGPSPEDIIAGALGGQPGQTGTSPLDVLRGILPNPVDIPTMRAPAPQPAQPAQPAPTPDTQTDTDLGPAAPNFWPLWIDQQDNLLKQCLKLMSGNMDDAQDALSEAMVKASTKFEESMDEIRNHRAWLSRIVHNACIDLHRQNRRKAEYREETHGSADTPASPMTAPIIPSPEESYLAGEKLDQLETALLGMQEKLRKPLLMRCVQDRTYDEIAEALGLSNCAVRKRVQLAREHLRGAGIQ